MSAYLMIGSVLCGVLLLGVVLGWVAGSMARLDDDDIQISDSDVVRIDELVSRTAELRLRESRLREETPDAVSHAG